MPSLYVVATPIGNLEDISQRAIRILSAVTLIAAEDTRTTGKLLSAYGIHTPLTSYHEHNKLTKLDYILDCLTKGDVALVSDAGMPGISDPGYELISALSTKNIPIIPIPGPSALISALVVSGLPTDRFLYLGFLPHKHSDRVKMIRDNSNQRATLIFYESPHRLAESLQDLLDILGDRRIAVCRELTKLHEEVFRGTLSEAAGHFTQPRGEFTLVVEGNTGPAEELSLATIEQLIRQARNSGKTARAALPEIARTSGRSRKELYNLWLKIK
jgi:16S rRNA (cytidine1402-2'-O)-methyltransferase